MSGLGLLVAEPWVLRLGWVLIHFLWQGAAVALLLAVGLRLLARASSHVRYAVIGGALLLCGVMPVATWMALGSQAQPMASPVSITNSVAVPEVESSTALRPNSPVGRRIESQDDVPMRWQDHFARIGEVALPYVVGLWFAGVVILTVRLSLLWMLMRRLCLSGIAIRDALCLERFQGLLARMQINTPVRLLESALVEVPTLIGWLRPAILVPTSVFIGLTPEQLEAILAHELAHVRRCDYLVNLFQTVIEIVLFYHPAVWWISRKLREERENCCDDMALAVTQDRLVYVRALAQLEEGRALPLALTASGGSLLQRIRRIAGANDRKVSAWPLWVLIIGILSVVCLTRTKATELPDTTKPSTQTASATKGDPTTLLMAVNAGDFGLVKTLLKQGVDPNAKGQLGTKHDAVARPIALAISDGNLDMAQLLLDHDAKADDYVTYALNMGDAKMVKLFWDHGVRSISELSYQISQSAPIEVLKGLLGQSSAANPPQDMVMTPLAVAAAFGNKPALDLLLAHGADPKKCGVFARDTWFRPNQSPPSDLLLLLSVAAENGQDEIVADLLSHGVQPTQEAILLAVERSSVSSDGWAGQRVHFENTVKLLIKAGALKNISPDEAGKILFSSIYCGGNPNPSVLKMLLDAGLSPQLKVIDSQGKSLIDYVRDDYTHYKQAAPVRAAWIKPSLDILEAANEGASIRADSDTSAKAEANAIVSPSAATTEVSQQMLAAVRKGDAAAVQKLIDAGADPKAVDKNGRTLLFDMGSPEVAELLLARGVDPNARDKYGDIALTAIGGNGNKNEAAILRVLLKGGANPNIRIGPMSQTPLMCARDGTTVDVLMEAGADPKAATNEGLGVFDFAGRENPSVFEALLRHGVAFNAKTNGPTVLLQASWVGNLSLMKDLLDRGVDPNVSGVFAMDHGHPDMMLPLQAAAVGNEVEAAKLLLAHGAKADEQMITALHNGYSKIVRLLWDSGARNTSELCFFVSQRAPIADLQELLDQGVPADPPQDKQITPLGEAAKLGNMEAVKLLVAHHADVNAGGPINTRFPELTRMSPLWLAASEGQDEVVAYLLQHGAKPEPAALWQAVYNSSPYPNQRSKDHFEKTVRILIDAGALKTVKPEMAGAILESSLGTRMGPPNAAVLKMLLDAGLSPDLPLGYSEAAKSKPDSVINYYRDYYNKNKNDPVFGDRVLELKPLLEMLEAADKGAR